MLEGVWPHHRVLEVIVSRARLPQGPGDSAGSLLPLTVTPGPACWSEAPAAWPTRAVCARGTEAAVVGRSGDRQAWGLACSRAARGGVRGGLCCEVWWVGRSDRKGRQSPGDGPREWISSVGARLTRWPPGAWRREGAPHKGQTEFLKPASDHVVPGSAAPRAPRCLSTNPAFLIRLPLWPRQQFEPQPSLERTYSLHTQILLEMQGVGQNGILLSVLSRFTFSSSREVLRESGA